MAKTVKTIQQTKSVSPAPSFVVMWDMPKDLPKSKFYRRLHELLEQQGGSANCRATQSAYIVEGDGAQALAYAIGALASAFGAGRIGEQDGVVVLPLGDIRPAEHFAEIKRATAAVQALTVDRRTTSGKKSPRRIDTPVSMQPSQKIIDLQEYFSDSNRAKMSDYINEQNEVAEEMAR